MNTIVNYILLLSSRPMIFKIIFGGIIFNKAPDPEKPPLNPWIEKLMEFYHIWPPMQWITSLIGLFILYGITGYFYNKWLSRTIRGHWLSIWARVWLIVWDLLLNLGLGLYYMDYRDTILGHIMMKCPIAISPVIFVMELLCVSGYYFYNYYLPFMPKWINFWEKRKRKKKSQL